MTENSSVFGLRHQARCLTPVTSSTEQSKFLAGTVGSKDNVVCLLEYDDDDTTITPTMYSHPEEVWDIVSCPTDENLLFTCHSPVSGNPLNRKATLWRKPVIAKDEGGRDQRHELTSIVTLEQEGIKKVLWDPKEQSQQIISIDASKIYLASMHNGECQTSLTVDVSPTFSTDTNSPSLRQLQNAVWNPHQPEIVTVGDRTLSGWDLRSGKSSFCKADTHKSTIRAVDYNPNKPYCVVTGGDDAMVNIWDVRQLSQPIMVVEGHSHWVWSVAFNRLQDQLLLTSGSDTLVNLHNVVSVSSASYLDSSSEDEDEDGQGDDRSTEKPTDGLICTYDQHEDSVYKAAWSPADTWTFVSISYAGRVVISQVPTNEKFKILGV
ncbi:protein TSSC1 [Mucor ambiguus]|uniref:Protein TSSC1 n=1 Tax=Mucor ambiguus TaxID=91626 RepID=A0A0C9MAE2_9FUNG|nr:protein TSSC1 [Mucor ambiguus]